MRRRRPVNEYPTFHVARAALRLDRAAEFSGSASLLPARLVVLLLLPVDLQMQPEFNHHVREFSAAGLCVCTLCIFRSTHLLHKPTVVKSRPPTPQMMEADVPVRRCLHSVCSFNQLYFQNKSLFSCLGLTEMISSFCFKDLSLCLTFRFLRGRI